MYAPSELLSQVEKQVKAKFGDQITHFEWFHEDEFTTIMVEIHETVMLIPIEGGIRQIVDAVVGDEYIVSISITSIESIDCTDGLFNLRFNGGGNIFFIDYYAPERPRSNPFQLSSYYTKMFDAVRTIHFDSASTFWNRLVRRVDYRLAERDGVCSFRRDVLAEPLRDFLIEHLDFIKHIADAVRVPLHIFEPTPPSALVPLSSNGAKPEASQMKVEVDTESPVQAALKLLQSEEQRRELLALLLQTTDMASVQQ